MCLIGRSKLLTWSNWFQLLLPVVVFPCHTNQRVVGCTTCSVSMAGHVGVVGRGRGAAKSFTLECSHSPSAAERDEANLRHRNRVCCRLVPVSPTWTTKSSLRNEELCNKSYPKSWELDLDLGFQRWVRPRKTTTVFFLPLENDGTGRQALPFCNAPFSTCWIYFQVGIFF